jgi:hypothetical protein
VILEDERTGAIFGIEVEITFSKIWKVLLKIW